MTEFYRVDKPKTKTKRRLTTKMSQVTTIEVTEEHIKKGVPTNRESCPIALAMKDAGFFNPSVEYSKIYYYESCDEAGDYGRVAVASSEVCDWQAFFDDEEYVGPITLELTKYDASEGYSVNTQDTLEAVACVV